MAWSKLVSLELSDDDKLDLMSRAPALADKPDYPPGLRICLTHVELEKLGLDADCEEGDAIDMRAFGTVLNISKGEGGCRVEIQLEKIAIENEMTEDETPGR